MNWSLLMEIRYLNLIALVLGAFIIIEVKSDELKIIMRGDPSDLAEGFTYERFNFLSEFIADGNDVNDTLRWNTCSNYTGIDAFLNATESEDCLGKVITCTSYPDILKINLDFFKIFHLKGPLINRPNALKFNDLPCESCRCLCERIYDSKPNSSIAELLDSICLDTVSADISNNYVVTGVRLNRLNNTLTFQIQQGVVFEGVIDESTVHWVPLPKKCNKIGVMNLFNRTLILDDVILTENWVVTGVAFQRYNKTEDLENIEELNGNPFYLSVFGHILDNNLNLNIHSTIKSSSWNFSLENRTNLINDHMDLPIALMGHNHVLSEPEKNYVTFEMTEPEEGLRKFVVPYVDTQKVTDLIYPQIVKGIGLYYKGYEGWGGYIAPRMFVSE